ncbi:MAG TPA: amino acid ABC transporter permease [Jatrophihabitans sp.]|jgi:glutamate transport system permease protein|uniref:amino acid ABC transporter permease n=1 Tax=Jatrophihabitans sp. TaxID=1932789 RepID=UPI002F1120A5
MTAPVLYDVQGPRGRRRVLISSIVGGLALLGLLALAARRLAANGQFDYDKYKPFFTEPQLYRRLQDGLENTLHAAVYAMVLAAVLGVLLAFGRLSRQPLIRVPVVAVIEFFRGVPLLLLIFALFLAFPLVVHRPLPALWALVLALTLYNGAVIAEIVRAGVQSIPKGQTEAAYAIGLSRGQTLRMVLLPQAVRVMLPALISQLVVLLKDTSLGFVIGFSELLRTGGQLVQVLRNPLQLYLAVALIYIVINSLLSGLAGYLEGRQRHTSGQTPVAPTQVEAGMGTL